MKEPIQIPFVAHESSMNRMERANKRLIIIEIIELIIIFAMFISTMIYFYLPDEVISDDISQNISEIEDGNIHQNIGE